MNATRSTTRRALASLLLSLPLVTLTAALAAESWPQFRGPRRDAVSSETGLLRKWPEGGPRVLWTVPLCEGYAAPAIHAGRVYVNDYDKKSYTWFVRCLDLKSGKELWNFGEKKRIRPNHGITRTVPAVDDAHVFSLDPKCVFHALDAKTGAELWKKSLPKDYSSPIPPWYAGQCPLIEEDRVVLAPGGNVLVTALEKATGKAIWESPNTRELPPSHASVMSARLGGVKQYLHATPLGVVGVSAEDGKELWFFERKFNVVAVPAPLPIGDDRVFVTSSYKSGCTMIQVSREGEEFRAKELFHRTESAWNSEVQTPILYENHIFAIGSTKRGLFTCLDLDGNEVWTSERQASFGLGGFLLADGMFFVLEGKTGMLRLLEANTTGYKELSSAQVLGGHDVWGPPALSNGKLLIRDMTQLVCVEVGSEDGKSAPTASSSK